MAASPSEPSALSRPKPMPGRSHWAVQRRHTLTPGLTWIRRDLPRPEVDQEDTSESDDRFQAVLELEVVQWRRHSKSVYVTNDERKAALTAVHVRCWRRGAEDHAELRQAYFPSSFMPNGGRLWFVAGSEPEWLEKEKGELADGTAAQTPKRPKKRKSIQKAPGPKKDPEDEADPEESNAAKKVSGSANDPKIGRTIWGQMETTMPAGELRDKLWKYLWSLGEIRRMGSAVSVLACGFCLQWKSHLAIWTFLSWC
ncbi:unnamed protein product [Cladocopium goreaui]|uniref:Uncharacterized protein n=1 Tax=Cladocopium goreaui TaxID=2562237 RepID=A0A9P1FQI8_9DINO|nr:unnamed protein product [Cladocopium goreaui]